MSCWVLLSSPGIPVMAPVCLEFNHYNNLDECNSIPHPEYVPLLVANPTLAGHRPPTTSTASDICIFTKWFKIIYLLWFLDPPSPDQYSGMGPSFEPAWLRLSRRWSVYLWSLILMHVCTTMHVCMVHISMVFVHDNLARDQGVV